MAGPLPRSVDTVIIGNGPSALILSYILHGHIPYYARPHHDPILDSKLSSRPNLLDLTSDLYAHFASSLRYSTQALPINTLLDTLLRPNADTEVNPTPCLEWRYEPSKVISHIAIGETHQPGGQWAEDPVSASWDIGTLSYAEMLSLPGYTYTEHLSRTSSQPSAQNCDFVRPSRAEVASYFAAYPSAVGISSSIHTSTRISNVSRTPSGFLIGSHDIHCKHLVLASGIFTHNLAPPPLLSPLLTLPSSSPATRDDDAPLLIIGSGFSAADAIISLPPHRRILHLYHWNPERPSPLRGCHHTAYPEYATVYRQMKLAASQNSRPSTSKSPLMRRKGNPFFSGRDWAGVYEGSPNAEVVRVEMEEGEGRGKVWVRKAGGEVMERSVSGLVYVVGRRGSLGYLEGRFREEVLGAAASGPPSEEGVREGETTLISGRTLRVKAEADLEVAPDVFIVGSLTGDSLIRHAVGGCVYAAGRILGHIPSKYSSASSSTSTISNGVSTPQTSRPTTPTTSSGSIKRRSNGEHHDLHLDRRKMARAVDRATTEDGVRS